MKIIAFGDSLTVGYLSPFEAAPYAEFLRLLLDPETKIDVAGVSGETTADMLLRFDRQVIQNAPDDVIILGGTNDLGWGVSIDQIVANLTRMYQMAQQADIVPVACAIPSLLGADDFIPPRMELNRRIQETANGMELPFADLFTPTADASGRLMAEYSQDGLHLTPAGYRKMAEIFYESVFRKGR
ncbi:MAG: GDSL-type esterase/lipase family protein [Candidatus Manganitrophaceae bacterium]